jgi:hypothetical protein
MPIYQYRCPAHGEFDSMTRADRLHHDCGIESRRVWGWNNASVLQSHYNPAFGCEISSRKQARELAKIASDDQSRRLGMTVNYELTDIHDHEAAGISREESKEYAARTAEATK